VPAQANVLIELRLASRCNIKRRTMSLLGHLRKSPFSALCQLSPGTDIPLHRPMTGEC